MLNVEVLEQGDPGFGSTWVYMISNIHQRPAAGHKASVILKRTSRIVTSKEEELHEGTSAVTSL